jgi:hypothetical protein
MADGCSVCEAHSFSDPQDVSVIKKGPKGPSFLYTSDKFVHSQECFLLFLHEFQDEAFFFAKLGTPF